LHPNTEFDFRGVNRSKPEADYSPTFV